MSQTEDSCLLCRQEVTEVPEEEENALDPNRKELKTYDAIECELCEHWFHASCLGWEMEKYRPVSAVTDAMKWFCSTCDVGFKKLKEKVTTLEGRVAELERGVERRINDKISDVLEERMEQEKRKNNLIFFGVPEAEEEVKGKDRATFDTTQLRSLGTAHKDLAIGASDIEVMYRIGKPKKDVHRPLCVKFGENKVKARVLRSGKYLRGVETKKSIFISPDLTKTQRSKNRSLYEELKKRREETEEDLMIKNGKIIKRPEKPQRDDGKRHSSTQKQTKATGKEVKAPRKSAQQQKPNDTSRVDTRASRDGKKKGNR